MEKTNVIKIAVIGAESTGKSALCEGLAKHFKTVWVKEYAREYFNDSDIYNCTLHDLEKIATKQLQMEEDMVKKANRFLFCDTSLITLKIWAQLEFNKVPEIIEEGLKKADYALYLLTNNDVPWEHDNQRQNKFSRDLILDMNLKEITKTSNPGFLVTGINQERLINAISFIENQIIG